MGFQFIDESCMPNRINSPHTVKKGRKYNTVKLENRQYGFRQTIWLQTDNMASDRQHGFRQTTWLQTDNMASDRQYGFGQTTWLQTE